MKYFRLTWEEILWEISYQNLLMLSATIPVYKSAKEKGKKKDELDPTVNIDSGQDLANFLGLKM